MHKLCRITRRYESRNLQLASFGIESCLCAASSSAITCADFRRGHDGFSSDANRRVEPDTTIAPGDADLAASNWRADGRAFSATIRFDDARDYRPLARRARCFTDS